MRVLKVVDNDFETHVDETSEKKNVNMNAFMSINSLITESVSCKNYTKQNWNPFKSNDLYANAESHMVSATDTDWVLLLIIFDCVSSNGTEIFCQCGKKLHLPNATEKSHLHSWLVHHKLYCFCNFNYQNSVDRRLSTFIYHTVKH